jgi:hypothetical protein
MRGVLAPTPCPVAALALAGCMGRTAPLAVVPQTSYVVPSGTSLRPGDTVLIGERWF